MKQTVKSLLLGITIFSTSAFASSATTSSPITTGVVGNPYSYHLTGTGTGALNWGFIPSLTTTRSGANYQIAKTAVVSTFAGAGAGHVDGTGTGATFYNPTRVAIARNGDMYVADTFNHRIRKITPAGVVSTFAGSTLGHADGTGTAATFYWPAGITIDSNGNIFVSDLGNNEIRKITPSGVVTTFAGSLIYGMGDGTGTAAKFYNPRGLAIDSHDNIYVADTLNNKIRKITPAGVVTTFAGNPIASAIAQYGYVDGASAGAKFKWPFAVAVDSNDNVYVADTVNNKIRKITQAGVVSTFAGAGAGHADGTGTAATFYNPYGIAIDSTGNIYVSDSLNHKIRMITSAGVVTTLAGSTAGYTNATGTSAKFNRPFGIAVDTRDNLYVADSSNQKIRKITFESTMIGTPTQAGTDDITLQLTDRAGFRSTQTFSIIVKDINFTNIQNYATLNTNPAPVLQDYTDAGVTGVTSTNIAAVNVLVDATNATGVDSTPKIQAFADTVNANIKATALTKIQAYANSNTNPTPTVQDYIDAGVTGVTTANLSAVNAKVDALTSAGVDTTAKIQALVDIVNTVPSIALARTVVPTPTRATPVAVTTTSSTITVTTTDGRDRSETGIKFDPSLSVSANGENERETRTNNHNIRGGVSTEGILTTSIDLGGGVKSSLENQRPGTQTSVDANGNINSVLTVDADNHLDTTLDNDGTVTHRTTAKGVTTEVRSSVKGATVTVDAQGTTNISSEVQNNGFIYRAIITVALDGTAKSKIVKIDIATNNEIESLPTLVIEGSFESGNKIEAFELNNMVYVKVSTPLNNAITIK